MRKSAHLLVLVWFVQYAGNLTINGKGRRPGESHPGTLAIHEARHSCSPGRRHNDDLSIATLNGLCREVRRLQTATTDFADRHGRYRVRNASADQCLSGAVLADTRCEHLPHDYFRNLLWRDAGARDQRFDDLCTPDRRPGSLRLSH